MFLKLLAWASASVDTFPGLCILEVLARASAGVGTFPVLFGLSGHVTCYLTCFGHPDCEQFVPSRRQGRKCAE